MYVVLLAPRFAGNKRDVIIREMAKRGIACSNYFQPIHLQPFYKSAFGYKKGDFPVAENISQRTLALPFFNNLQKEHIEFVIKHFKKILENV